MCRSSNLEFITNAKIWKGSKLKNFHGTQSHFHKCKKIKSQHSKSIPTLGVGLPQCPKSLEQFLNNWKGLEK